MYSRLSNYLLNNIFVQLPPPSTYKCYSQNRLEAYFWRYDEFVRSDKFVLPHTSCKYA